MKYLYPLLTSLITSVFAQPGQIIDQTTVDIQFYWNTATNQVFVNPESGNVYLGYMWSADTENIIPEVRIKNITTGQLMQISDGTGHGFGLPDIRRHEWGNLLVTLTSGGLPWIFSNDWANGVSMYIESEVGQGEFEELFWVNEAPASEPEYALAGWTLVDPDGRIHSLIYDGWGFGFVYKYSDDGGFVFSPGVIIAYDGEEEFLDNVVLGGDFYNQPFGIAFNSDGEGHVTVAVTDQGGDILLYESFTGGESWQYPLNITGYGDNFGGDSLARPDRFIDGLFDANGHLHLVWEASYWMDLWQESERHPWPGYGEELPYPADKRGRLIHWSESTGLSTIAVSQFPLVNLNEPFGSITGREKGCMISMPSISLDESNDELVVGYVQYSEEQGEVTPNGEFMGYGELYFTKSTDNGINWAIPENVTTTPNMDERQLFMNETLIDGEVHLMYFADDLPGYNVFNEFGNQAITDIYYHTVTLTETTTALYGCTNSEAYNYNSDANLDDGSCEFFTCCIDHDACNYDESCLPFHPQDCDYEECLGCMDTDASNYDPFATQDNGSCLYGTEFALNFDGSNDFVLIEDHSDFDFTSNYTLEAWIFPEEFEWLGGIISKYMTSGASGWTLRLHSVEPFDGLEFDEMKSPTGILGLNQWMHVAAVNNNGDRSLYVNGEEVNLTGNALSVTSNSDDIRIASDFNDRYFNGVIDEIRIWNIPLSQIQIQANMDEPLTGTEGHLMAYYNFNEGTGDTLHDLSANGHHGIIYNGPSWVNGVGGEILLGDINFDGDVNILDCVMMVAFIMNFETTTDFQWTASDTNGDGLLNVADVILVISWILEDWS